MPSLSSLVVDLQANTSALRSGLDAAAEHLKSFGEKVSAIDEKIKGLGEMKGIETGKELVEGLAEFVQQGAEAAELAGKLAQATGMPVESFSRLSYAANLSHVSTEDFAKSLEKLDKNLGAAGGGATKQSALFQALGVSVKDAQGNVRGTEDVLGDLAGKFSSMEDGASKTALAMEVFGKSGAQLIPFLNEGKSGIEELEAEADRLGITISGHTAAAATQFEDNLKRLKLAAQGVAAQAAGQLAPALTTLTNQLLGSKDGADALKEASTVLANTLKVLVSAGVIVSGVFDAVGTTLARVASAIANFVQGNFKEALNDAVAVVANEDLKKASDAVGDRLKAVWSDATTSVTDSANKQRDVIKGLADQTEANFQRLEKAPELFKKGMEALTKVLDEYGKQSSLLAGGGKDPLAEIEYRLDKGDLAKDLARVGDQADQMRQKILEAAAALEALKVGNLKVQLTFDNKLAGNQLDFNAGQRTQAFNNIGSSQGSIWAQATAGFADFNDALEKQTAALKEKADWTEQAKIAEAKGDSEGARGALEFAQQAQFAADKAGLAATAFEQAKAAESQFVGGLKVLGQAFTSKLGQLGTTIDDAIKGFQQGGIWGALAALVMDLLSMMDGWKTIQNIAQGALMRALSEMSSGLNGILSALGPVMGAVESIASAVHSVLGPILELIGKLLQGITPIIELVGIALQNIGSSLAPVFEIIGAIITPTLQLLAPILEAVAIVFAALKLVTDEVTLAFNQFIDWLDHTFNNGNNGEGVAAAMGQVQEDQYQLMQLVNDPNGLADIASNTADGLGQLGASSNDASKSLSKFNQDIQNAPDGYKIAGTIFKAIAPTGGGMSTPMGSFGRTPISIDKLEVKANSITDLYNQLLLVHHRGSGG